MLEKMSSSAVGVRMDKGGVVKAAASALDDVSSRMESFWKCIAASCEMLAEHELHREISDVMEYELTAQSLENRVDDQQFVLFELEGERAGDIVTDLGSKAKARDLDATRHKAVWIVDAMDAAGIVEPVVHAIEKMAADYGRRSHIDILVEYSLRMDDPSELSD